MDTAEKRLATYGTLAPGRPNHKILDGMNGRWMKGRVKGHLKEEGWGAELGFPGLVLDDAGSEVALDIFVSADLPDHWDRLDAFEGEGYRRVAVDIATDEGVLPCSIYVLRE